MKKLISALLTVGILMGLSGQSYAAGATCDEAKAMAEKAFAFYKTNGAEKAFATFQAKDPAFFDRDLYIFAVGKNGIYTVHATKPMMVGKDALVLKDSDGKEFFKEIVALKSNGWVEYKYPDPSDGSKVKQKKSYIVTDGENFMGVGCYVN